MFEGAGLQIPLGADRSCPMAYRIRLAKENFKFSCSHFTITGERQSERLHGHNYYVSVEVVAKTLDPRLGMAFEFGALKSEIRALVDDWDEFVLLPELSPYLKLFRSEAEVGAVFADRHYSFPAQDVRVLAAVNITSEELARLLAEKLLERMKRSPEVNSAQLASLSVGVQETRGQTVFYEIAL